MKRILSLFLALILCFGLFTVALGDGEEGEGGSQSEETSEPVDDPTDEPTHDPIDDPTHDPTDDPTHDPTHDPTDDPTKPTRHTVHSWSKWTTTKTAKCTEKGVEERYCNGCYETQTREIAALGHDWGSWADNGDGTHTRDCRRIGCGEKESASHSGGGYDASDTEHWKKCSVCGAEYERAAHDFNKTWEKDDTKHWQVCAVCGYRTESEVHKWNSGQVTKAASCVSQGTKTYTCTVCGATKTESIPLTNHSWDGGTTIVQPTVTEKGESEFKCIVCGKTTTREIPPLGQTMLPEELLTIDAKPGNALNGRLDDENWVILQAVTTEEEYSRIQTGWPIIVTLGVEDVTDSIGDDMMQKVQESAKNQKIYCALRMELTKQLHEDVAKPVTETTEPIIVALTLPEEIQQITSRRKERGFTVYRIGEEKVKKVTAKLSSDGESLRFQTDSFGTYVLTYHDKSTRSIDPMVFLYGGLALVTLGGIGFLAYKLFFAKGRETFDDDDEEYEEYEE